MVWLLFVAACGSLSCSSTKSPSEGSPQPLVVAAAANLTDSFGELGAAFSKETGIAVTYDFGSTAQLTQQIENGAPFDVFAAADVAHVDQLVQSGKILAASRAVYARGRLALWSPENAAVPIQKLEDLLQPSVRFVAIANPAVAPYGAAAVEALRKRNLWDRVQPKIVQTENVNAAKQLAATGNAEAAFTAYSLVFQEPGHAVLIDAALYSPIDQALGVVAASPQRANAERFASFVLRGGGRAILQRYGYELPPTR